MLAASECIYILDQIEQIKQIKRAKREYIGKSQSKPKHYAKKIIHNINTNLCYPCENCN